MNPRQIWKNFAAKQYANTIATIPPKISFPKNKELQNQWDELVKWNNLLKINYKLVNNSHLNKVSFLGLKDVSGIPILVIGESSYYKMNANKLVELNVKIDELGDWGIYEIYDINENNELKNIVQRYALNKNTNEKANPISLSYKYTNNSFLKTLNIPFAPFFSNPLENDELENVDEQLFQDWKDNIDILITDSLVSKGIIHLNTPQMNGSSENITRLKKALTDPKEVLFENQSIFSLLQQGGIQIQQGQSNYLSILEKLKFLENKIKQFGFLKKETSDLGTKNLQTSETELLNSDADDYVELKANLMELQWEYFIRNVFFDYLKEIKNINTDFKNAVIEIEISGSTINKNDKDKLGQASNMGAIVSVRKIMKELKNNNIVCLPPDGPRGPLEEINGEVIAIAKKVNVEILPAVISYSFRIKLGSWDRFQIPLPFGRILIEFASPLTFDDYNDLEKSKYLLKEKMTNFSWSNYYLPHLSCTQNHCSGFSLTHFSTVLFKACINSFSSSIFDISFSSFSSSSNFVEYLFLVFLKLYKGTIVFFIKI